MSDLLELFAISVLISLATFGGGAQALYYQLAVEQQGWISKTDLSAVLAFGYATPGPAVFGTSVFIGYKLAGIPGAIVGSVAVFLVPFIGSVVAARYLMHLLKHTKVQLFIKGVGLAAAGLVAATAVSLLGFSNVVWWQLVIAGLAFVASLRYQKNPLLVVVVSGLIGWYLS